MPSLPRTVRSLLIAACAVVALAAWTATAEAGVAVVIQPPGNTSPKSISTDDVTPDIGTGAPQPFQIAKPGGGAQRVEVSNGVSLQKLLSETGTNFNFETISIERPDRSSLTLTKDQVRDPRNQQVFYTDAQGVTRFIGPRQANGIVQAKDYFAVAESISVTQWSQGKLQVTISPKKKKIGLGESVTFTATVSGALDESVTYTWWLAGRKQKVAGRSFTQKFPKKDDVYKFSVAARIEGSETSVTAVATITVGDPEKADEEQTGGGEGDTGSDGGTTDGSVGGSGSSSSYTPSYTPAPVTPSEPAPTPTPTPEPPDIATSGTPVEGNLLADVSDPPPSNILESAAAAARQGKQKDDDADDGDLGVSEAAVSVFAALALLGIGAGIETRQGRMPRLRVRLPRRAG